MNALVLALLCSAAAPLADGIALYQSLEFERAAIHFQGMVLDADAPVAERAQASMWAGVALGQLGDVEGARRAFALAVATDPAVAAPDDAPPALRSILENERADLAARPPPPPAPEPAAPLSPPTHAPDTSSASANDGAPWPAIGAGILAGVLVVGASAAGIYGAMQYATSADPAVPARPAFEAYDASVTAGWTAAALGGVAVVAGGVSAVLFLAD